MAAPPVYRQPLDGSEMVRVLKDGRWYLAPVTAIAALYDATALTARLAADEAALATEAAARASGDSAEAANRSAADTAATGRLAALEAKPEEVAHFTASAKFPTVAVGASFILTLNGLTPARAGDILKAGEQVEAWPTGTVPAGVTLGRPAVTADNTVSIPCTAGLAIAVSSAPVPFALAALR